MLPRIPLTVNAPTSFLPRIPVTFIGFWQGRRIDDIVPIDTDELLGQLRQWRDYFTTFTANITAQNFSQATASFAPRVFAFLDETNAALADIERGGIAAVAEARVRELLAKGHMGQANEARLDIQRGRSLAVGAEHVRSLIEKGSSLYFESRTFYRAIMAGTRTRPDFIAPPPEDDFDSDPGLTESPEISSGAGSESSDMDMEEE